MVKAMSITESFMYTAGKVFGKSDSSSAVTSAATADEMMALADQING